MIARTLNLLLGSWLFLSAFLWPHAHPVFTNTWLVGALCAVVAVAGFSNPQARYWNLALSAWLAFSALWMPHEAATLWNNLIVALAMFALALVPSREPTHELTLEQRLQVIANAIAREKQAMARGTRA